MMLRPKRLWKVTNGYTGYSAVHVLIITEAESDALRVAGDVFKAASDERVTCLGASHGYEQGYWTDLTATMLCPDTSEFWVSGVMDE